MKGIKKKQNGAKKGNAKPKKKLFIFWEYDSKSIVHNLLFLLVAAMLIGSVFWVRGEYCEYDDDVRYIAYDKDFYTWQSPYMKQFDAFLKGQLHLDVKPSEGLLELENPYDPAERANAGIEYLWDHAFYEGKYYSYFGAAPLLTVYLPIYLITGGLPSDAYATVVLAVYAAIFLALAYREAVLRFAKRANLWLFLLGLYAIWAVSGAWYSVFTANFYCIPVISALGCSMAFIFFALRAMRVIGTAERMTLLALAAVSLGLTVLSRPSVALMCVAFFPVFFEYLFKSKKKEWRKTLATVASFAVPLIICAAAIMWYNAARFSSPFDFGEKYQLTVSDVSENTMEKSFFFSSLFSYFLYPFWRTDKAPFIEMSGHMVLPTDARYVYAEHYAGAFAFVLPMAILLCPHLARRERDDGKRDITKNAVMLCAVLLAISVGYVSFCKAGVHLRYILDIVPVLSLVGALVLLSLSKSGAWYKKAPCAILCLCAFSASIHVGYAFLELVAK